MDQQTLDWVVTPTIKALVGVAVDKFLKPSADRVAQSLGDLRDEGVDFFVGKFSEYTARNYARLSHLATLAYPNESRLLDELYAPLTLHRREIPGEQNTNKYLIDGYPKDLFSAHHHVLVVDTAGMGKSTLIKYIFLRTIEQSYGIPILIELRKISPETSFIDFILSEMQGLLTNISPHFLREVLLRGDFVFLLDGVDEVPLSYRASVIRNLLNFIALANNNLFVLTSRDEPSLAAFAEFQRFQIMPLSEEDAFILIRKYILDPTVAESLINRLSSPDYVAAKEFLVNPLLVSLLCRSFEYKKTIPLKLHIFYRQVYDALFETHDLSKDGAYARIKHSGLDVEQFHTVLRAFGFRTYMSTQIDLDADRLTQEIEWARANCLGIEFSVSAFKQDITTAVPLLAADGLYYRWAHRSIQEYFAASFICRDLAGREIDFFQRLSNDVSVSSHVNLLLLCADLNYGSFARGILRDLLQRYTRKLDEALNLFRGIIPPEEIIRRHELLGLSDLVAVDTRTESVAEMGGAKTNNTAIQWMNSQVTKVLGVTLIQRNWQFPHVQPSTVCIVRPLLDQLLQRLAMRADISFVNRVDAATRGSVGTPPAVVISEARLVADDPEEPFNSSLNYVHLTDYLQGCAVYRFNTSATRQLLADIDGMSNNDFLGDFFRK